jgi:hypothetical protein
MSEFDIRTDEGLDYEIKRAEFRLSVSAAALSTVTEDPARCHENFHATRRYFEDLENLKRIRFNRQQKA